MSASARTASLCLVLGFAVSAGRLTAQSLGTRTQLFAGLEGRSLSFQKGEALRKLWQVGVPFGAVIGIGRFQLDLGSAFVATELTRIDSSSHRVDHLTDTQLRGSYVFGRDALVATLAFNLPTGPRHASMRDYTVIGAVSPSFFGFPFPAYASGFSATGGLAAALPAGQFSVGLAGSVRVSSRFEPYEDAAGPFVYKPGIEGRIRAGADGIVGPSRLSLGVTYSTFGDDQFGSGGILRGQYRPGPRWLAEAALAAPAGSTTINISVWDFLRLAGDSTGIDGGARNRENLAAAEVLLSVPLGTRIRAEPAISGRISNPQAGHAQMLGFGLGLEVRLSDELSVVPTGRFDTGSVKDPSGLRTGLRGAYGSASLRATF